MHWIHLTDEDQLQKIVVRSQEKPQIVFKYSSCCPLSETIFQGLQKNRCPQQVDFHFLDLTDHADIAEKVSSIFQVSDLAPQILIIKDGECIFSESDAEICLEQIMEHVTATV